MIEIVILGPPRGWQRVQNNRGQHFTHPKTREYEETLKNEAIRILLETRQPLMEGPIKIKLWACLPVPESWSGKKKRAALEQKILPAVKPDFDNIAKMLDGLNGIVWNDDKQIVDFRIVKRYDARPRLAVQIQEIV